MAKKAKGGGDDAAEKKSPKKKIIIGVVALAAGWKLGFIPIAQRAEDAGAVGTTTTTAVVEGDTVEVGDPITVNLADTDVARYARVAVALVLNEHPSEESDEHAAEAEHTEETVAEAEHTEETGAELPAIPSAGDTAATEGEHAEAEHTEETVAETPATEADADKGAASGKAASARTAEAGGGEVDPVEAVEGRFPAVQNLVIVELRQWTYAQLMAPDALQVLQERLTLQVQEIYEHDEVVRVVFTQFVVQ